MIPSTQGYAEQADELIPRYEGETFETKHSAVLHLVPKTGGSALDIGAGTGGDAAWFAARGYTVVAVEPTARLRDAGKALHPEPAIAWVDDSLPALASVRSTGQRFTVIMLSAVWMHLDEAEREPGMSALASLLSPDGVLLLSLRHGPVPAGRRMFEVSGEETISLAAAQGLECILEVRTESVQAFNRAAGITWTRLAFNRPRTSSANVDTGVHRRHERSSSTSHLARGDSLQHVP